MKSRVAPNEIVIEHWDGIAVAAARLLNEALGGDERPYENVFMRVGMGATQQSVDIALTEADCKLPPDELAAAFLAPMAAALAHRVPKGATFYPLEIPAGYQAARARWKGVSVRVIAAWWPNYILDHGLVAEFEELTPIIRMDVLVSTKQSAGD